MKIGISLMALSLLACSPVLGGDTDTVKPLQLVTVSGTMPSDCAFQLDDVSIKLQKPSQKDMGRLTAAGDILVAGTGDTAFQCVTMAIDKLNDLGIYAEYEEKAWHNLASVAAGREKVEQDIAGPSGHPEATPFDKSRDASADFYAALDRTDKSDNNIILVMGANWCHDSRALAGWFESPRFARMLAKNYEVVYADVGYRDRNIDLAKSFGLDGLKGTPTVLVVGEEAELLNAKTAPTWRNAASRSEDEIFKYFAQFEEEF